MIKRKSLLIYFVLFSFINKLNSQFANYVSNGGFEKYVDCSGNNQYLSNAIDWDEIDLDQATVYCNVCLGSVPNSGWSYQYPSTGNAYVIADMLCFSCASNLKRTYLKNRLKSILKANTRYCVKFHVNIGDLSSYGTDGFGAYFGNNSIDSINQGHIALTYLNPQVQNLNGNIITDTLNWTTITGTFTAIGDEKYVIIGNFKSDLGTNILVIQPTYSTNVFCTVLVDDVSCIPIDLPAYAGPNKSCIIGDSVFIGRSPDVEIDESCIWYKLNSNGTLSAPIDTVAGLYVKPISTTTYVVRQQLWCSGVKWDTVVVYQDYVGLPKIVLNYARTDIGIYPQPADDYLVAELVEATTANYYISIVNNFGQVIKEEEIIFKNKKAIINTKDLENGVYVLKLKSAENLKQVRSDGYLETVSKKFVIRR